MKSPVLLFFLLFCLSTVFSQTSPFRFIHISDTHIGSPNGSAEEDLRRTVQDINQLHNIAFVIITGDITELGTDEQLKLAKQILDSLQVKYYIIPGNHDAGWSESGGVSFNRIFGYDKFHFDYNGIRFIGCASGPYVRMSDGHIPRDAIVWLDSLLQHTDPRQPMIFCNHYPIDNSLDNWYEITDRLRKYNTVMIMCGHGHINKAFNFEDIPGVMGRSNLRVKDPTGGYNIVEVGNDSIIYAERKPELQTLAPWAKVKIEDHHYSNGSNFSRPAYAINEQYAGIHSKWVYSSNANVISTPAVSNGIAIFGNQLGEVVGLDMKDGRKIWSFKTGGSIFSSPASSGADVVLGSGDGFIYCLESKTGRLQWKLETGAAVLGSPIISHDTVFIGGSDHSFRAVNLTKGTIIWKFSGLQGPVVSTALLYGNMVIFGAWDKYLYALDKEQGKLLWKWSNGSAVINYSPASCIPVAHNGIVYVVAPDRYITAIDVLTGTTLWRNNEATVRESLGISADGKYVYGKTMQDTIVAYATNRMPQHPSWKMNCGFGYEHVPSMLIENNGKVYFGTRNGVVYAIDPKQQKISWAHKIDNSMVNTLRVLDNNQLLVSTMDGKVTLLEQVNKK